MPTYTVPSHPGVLIVNPEIRVVCTLDIPGESVFKPSIEFLAENIHIHYDLPSQPYVNGTWDDTDVDDAVIAHLLNLLSDE